MAQARSEMPLLRKIRPKGPRQDRLPLPKQPESALSYICNLPLSNYLQEPRIKDRDRQRTMTLPVSEFIRRFLLHVLPSGFHRIRHYGLLASGARARNIARVRQLLTPAEQSNPNEAADDPGEPDPPNPYPCPCCGGRMIVVETFGRAGPSSSRIRIDTS